MINLTEPYEKLSDKELIHLIRNDDKSAQEYIISRYKSLVKIVARAYFILGGDKDDIIQEGMIGLFKAVNEYNESKKTDFSSFASLCINRQIINAIEKAGRKKHLPLNNYLSFDKDISGRNTFSFIESLGSFQSPEEMFIDKENLRLIEDFIKASLSKFEYQVFSFFIIGRSQKEIAEALSKNEKSIDNAIQRIRKKLFKMFEEKSLTKGNLYAKI